MKRFRSSSKRRSISLYISSACIVHEEKVYSKGTPNATRSEPKLGLVAERKVVS